MLLAFAGLASASGSVSVDCRLTGIAYDVDLGSENAGLGSEDTIDVMCIDVSSGAAYHLTSHDSKTMAILNTFEWNANVHLTLAPFADETRPVGIGGGGSAAVTKTYRVVKGRSTVPSFSHAAIATSASSATGSSSAMALDDSGRFFEGGRRMRLLSVLVEVNGLVPEYAGSTRAVREAWAVDQRRFMSGVYEWSTYGKLGLDDDESVVRTVVVTQQQSNDDCTDLGFEIARLAADQLEAEGFDFGEVDGILYYEPEDATPACSCGSGCGTLGICYVGLLQAPTYEPDPFYRDSPYWKSGCFVRYQKPGAAARSNVGAHEFAHHLGLGHAGGNGNVRSASGQLTTYGDSSAVMGNDASQMNSFTAPARYYLGALPESAIEMNIERSITLHALSTGPTAYGSSKLAVVVPCPGCASRTSGLVTGGEIWITFRGDGETCNTEHVEGSDLFRCHRDHSVKYNQVHIHYKRPGTGPQTEKWYWLDHQDDAFQLPSGGLFVRVCAIGSEALDAAIVAVGNSAGDVDGKCAGTLPPPSPPMPPSPPSPPPPPFGCTDTCNYAFDGECDDGGEGSQYDVCPDSTDCADCGPRTSRASPPPPFTSPPPPPPPSPSPPPPMPFPPPAPPSPLSPPVPGIACSFIVAGSVDSFDTFLFTQNLLRVAPTAHHLINVTVSAASVVVYASLVYERRADSEADAARLQQMNAQQLSSTLGVTVERWRFASSPVLDAGTRVTREDSRPPSPPAEHAGSRGLPLWLTLAAFLFISIVLVALAAAIVRCISKRKSPSDKPTAHMPAPPRRHSSLGNAIASLQHKQYASFDDAKPLPGMGPQSVLPVDDSNLKGTNDSFEDISLHADPEAATHSTANNAALERARAARRSSDAAADSSRPAPTRMPSRYL